LILVWAFRWVCASGRRFTKTDTIACGYWKKWQNSSIEIQQQMQDNIQWIKAQENKLVVGSQARILYADAEGRVKLLKLLIRLLQKAKLQQ
jgi:urocanate hydratase